MNISSTGSGIALWHSLVGAWRNCLLSAVDVRVPYPRRGPARVDRYQTVDEKIDWRKNWLISVQFSPHNTHSVQVRSGMGAYGGAARRRVHLATVLLRPPSGHRPGRRQTRHARILQIELHLTQPWNVWSAPQHDPAPRISTRKNPIGGILRRESRHMPIEA